jgi:hypothetical protein
MKGTVLLQYQGITSYARPGNVVKDLTEITTERGAEIVLRDNYEHRFHLISDSMVKILNKTMVLKNGNLRFISFNMENEFEIQTSNAVVTYNKTDAILNMNVENGKTQVLVLSGKLQFSNQTEREKYSVVDDGQFSFLSNDQNEGFPRKPTPVGKNSYLKIASIFKNSELNKHQDRSIASEHSGSSSSYPLEITRFENYEPKNTSGGPGKIIYLQNKDKENSKAEMKKFYASDIKESEEIRKKNRPNPFAKNSNVPIKIFGIPGTASNQHNSRNLASPSTKSNLPDSTVLTPSMKQGLKSRWVKQVPHKDLDPVSKVTMKDRKASKKTKEMWGEKTSNHDKTNPDDYLKTERNNLEAKKIIQELNSH